MFKLSGISNIGIYPGEEKEYKKIKLLNVFCITWFFFLLLFIITDPVSSAFKSNFFIHLCSMLAIFLVFILHKFKKYLAARIVFLSAVIIATFVFASIVSPAEMMEIFYFIYPLVSLVLIDKKWISILFMIACYVLYNYTYIVHNDIYSEKIINPILSLTVFIGSFVILEHSQSLNRKNEIALKENKKTLQIAYNQLEDSKKKELAHLELQSLKSQMNPHFIFNALNSIQEYIVLNQKRLASDYLGKFADLIRTYLNQSLQDYITLEEEIGCLNMYLELEKLRFEDKLSYTINYSDNLELDTVLIPTMLLQPYVENAIKHGLLHKKEKGTLIIDFKKYEEEKLLHCSITDNGIGRDKANSIRLKRFASHRSFASKATEDRLTLINGNLDKNSKKATVIIVDLFENSIAKGTQVNITIPIKTL